MNEFIEKLIGRLEEKFKYNSEQAEIYRDGSDKDAYFREKKDLYMDRANTYGEVMRIVNQLAEEYKNTNIITDFLQYARDNADNYDTNEGWSLADLIDLSIKYSEEYINTSTDTSTNTSTDTSTDTSTNTSTDTSSGWIACSERLPKKSGKYLITQERYSLEDRLCKRPIAIEVDYVMFNATDNLWARASFFKVIAWQPLPAPYKEGATENE